MKISIQFGHVNGKVCHILPRDDGDFNLWVDAGAGKVLDFVAEDPSPRLLYRSALDSGASKVVWDFDLSLAGDR